MRRFQIPTGLFVEALRSVSQSVRENSPFPIHRHIAFSVDGNRLVLSANDGERGARRIVYLSEPVSEPFQLLLPARFLRDLTARISPKAVLEFAVKQPNDPTVTLLVKDSRSKFTIAQYLGGEYYDLVQTTEDQTVQKQLQFYLEPLIHLLQLMFTCAFKDEARISLMGVRVEYFENERRIRCVSTDTHRMLVYETDDVLVESPDESGVIYFFPSTLQQLKGYLQAMNLSTIDVQVYPERLLLKDAHGELVFVQTLPANIQYPDYQKILQATFDRCVLLDRGQLLERLGRLSVYDHKVIFHFKDHTVELVTYGDLGMGVETLEISESVGNFMIAFNMHYLQETLSRLADEQVEMHFWSENNLKPVHFTSVGRAWTLVVMPMVV